MNICKEDSTLNWKLHEITVYCQVEEYHRPMSTYESL